MKGNHHDTKFDLVYQNKPTIMFDHGPSWLRLGHIVSITIFEKMAWVWVS